MHTPCLQGSFFMDVGARIWIPGRHIYKGY